MSEQAMICTLSQADLERVTARYAEAAEHYEASIRFEGAEARIRLRGGKRQIGALLDEMMVRERACCPFLRFVPEETEDGYNLRLGVTGASGLERPLLREAVQTLFPTIALGG